MKKRVILPLALLSLIVSGCSKDDNTFTAVVSPSSAISYVTTDKATYDPSQMVYFSATGKIQSNYYVRYFHLGDQIDEHALTSLDWSFQPPTTDFRGYLAQIYSRGDDGTESTLATISFDVASDISRFPRNGFLSYYTSSQKSGIESVVANLNRYRLNVVQFQDWHNKHHMPLAGTPENPSSSWYNISGHLNQRDVVEGYIESLHKRNIETLSYNLCLGAWESSAATDGVKEEWYIFSDTNHTNKDYHVLSQPPFLSNLVLTDPSNTEWMSYLGERTSDIYEVFDFDGYQIDQLGSRGTRYKYDGSQLNLESAYATFIAEMKRLMPNKRLVMNAVGQYGQSEIITSNCVDFLYTEVWGDMDSFADLKTIVDFNDAQSSGLKTVLAAYMNYNVANSEGYFNTPGVLLTDAIIFALGGAHLELGEHMLGKEYFPNNNLTMKSDLKSAIVTYYDFMTAYENLLRDGGSYKDIELTCSNAKVTLNMWPPVSQQAVVLCKEMDSLRDVIHIVNTSQANLLSWRDIDGNMPEPDVISSVALRLQTAKTIDRIWVASPDIDGGIPIDLEFTQTFSSASFTLPSLKYWDMIVVEYE